ncbi:unnamed protein product [Phytophthora fragariaefolia]|uniref:Unnamed protein product n=1 Tax=Phytophthora fragariaefolia TaxID=1490495 RepID=A0A9W6TMT7_9STRA|nr:unnamed protein product [Phytophthora fragariaefolia]
MDAVHCRHFASPINHFRDNRDDGQPLNGYIWSDVSNRVFGEMWLIDGSTTSLSADSRLSSRPKSWRQMHFATRIGYWKKDDDSELENQFWSPRFNGSHEVKLFCVMYGHAQAFSTRIAREALVHNLQNTILVDTLILTYLL